MTEHDGQVYLVPKFGHIFHNLLRSLSRLDNPFRLVASISLILFIMEVENCPKLNESHILQRLSEHQIHQIVDDLAFCCG